METASWALLTLGSCVIGIYGCMFTMSKNQNVSKFFLILAWGGCFGFLATLASTATMEENIYCFLGLAAFLCILFAWYKIDTGTKDKREAKEMRMGVQEYIDWRDKTLKILKEKLEAQGTLNYDNLLEAFNEEKTKFRQA